MLWRCYATCSSHRSRYLVVAAEWLHQPVTRSLLLTFHRLRPANQPAVCSCTLLACVVLCTMQARTAPPLPLQPRWCRTRAPFACRGPTHRQGSTPSCGGFLCCPTYRRLRAPTASDSRFGTWTFSLTQRWALRAVRCACPPVALLGHTASSVARCHGVVRTSETGAGAQQPWGAAWHAYPV